MAGFLIHTIVLAIAIWATANVVPGVTITSWSALAVWPPWFSASSTLSFARSSSSSRFRSRS